MSWVMAAIAAWLLPAVMMMFFALAVTLWTQCSHLTMALRRRRGERDVGDEQGPQQ